MNTQEIISPKLKTNSKYKKILMVDDDKFIEIVTKFIQKFNYQTIIANEGMLQNYTKKKTQV